MSRQAAAAGLALALLCGAAVARPAAAVGQEVVRSVVAVLPVQPGGGDAQGPGPSQEPEGSAVALADGLFVTAAHVLGPPGTGVVLRTADGRVYEAQVRGRSPATDLALLTSAAPARPAQWGEPPSLGDRVCAVGNAFGLGISLACGVVSQTRVTHAGFNRIEDFMQTDAATNPGMSGGALVDADGRLVGVLAAIFTKQSDANIGVNFAVSRALTRRVVAALRADGGFDPPAIGVQLAPQPRLRPREHAGARVAAVTDGGPAARAGLRPGDLLTRLAGRDVRRPSDAVTALALSEPGTTVAAAVRRAGAKVELEIALPTR